MPATTLVLAATVLATAGQGGARIGPLRGTRRPTFSRSASGQDAQNRSDSGRGLRAECPWFEETRRSTATSLTPDALSGNRVHYSMRRAPSTHMQCPEAKPRQERE